MEDFDTNGITGADNQENDVLGEKDLAAKLESMNDKQTEALSSKAWRVAKTIPFTKKNLEVVKSTEWNEVASPDLEQDAPLSSGLTPAAVSSLDALPEGFDPFESTLPLEGEETGFVQNQATQVFSVPPVFPAGQSASQLGSQLAGQTVSQPVSQSAGQSASQLGSQPVSQNASQELAHNEALAYIMGQSYAQGGADARQEQVFQPTQAFQSAQPFQPGQYYQPAQPAQSFQPTQSLSHDEALAYIMGQSYAQDGADVQQEQVFQPIEESAPKKKHKKLRIVLIILAVLLCACVGVAWAAHVSVHEYIAKINQQNEQNAQALIEWELARKVDLATIPENGQQVATYGLASMGAAEGQKDPHVQRIESLIADYGKSDLISFEAYSLDGKSAICYNTELTHYSACTIKAPYIYWCCQQLESGKGNLWDTMTYSAKYAFPGSGTIQYSAEGTQYSVADLIYYAMFISDNTAYNMLHSYFGGGDAYNEWIKSAGMPSLVVEGLWGYNIKASDLTKIWTLYYQYFQSSNSDIRNALYRACTNSYAAFACEHMPYTYSHKSGNTYYPDEQYNDAGIIWIEGHPYSFAFLSKTEGEGWDSGVMCEIMNELSALMSKDDPQPNAPEVEEEQWTWEGWKEWLLASFQR